VVILREWLLDYLVCPKTHRPLKLISVQQKEGDCILEGLLGSNNYKRAYRIVRGVPRFVESHYATGFGLQWNIHESTQIDNERTKHSTQRFWGETGFDEKALANQVVLDAGCGAGRFTDVVSRAKGRVIGVDLSEAVDAAYRTLGARENVAIVQASIFELPFLPGTFDYVYTIGVIQHTPDPLRALRCIASMGKPDGGQVGVSWYKKYWYTYLHQKYWLRPIFRNWDERKLYEFVEWYAPYMLKISRALSLIPGFSKLADRILPVANRDSIPGLSEEDKLKWAVLDTFDWYNPTYDKPQKWKDVIAVMEEYGYRTERAPLQRTGLHCVRSA